jgi:phage major head subunit gpT-like protein
MLANLETIQALNVGFKAIFNKAKENTQTLYQRVATTVPSSAAQNNYAWLGSWPMLREWVGERVVKALEAHGYTVVNKTFEATVGVRRDDIDDDNLGIYNPQFEQLGTNAAKHPDKLVFDLLKNGTSGLCYDGQYFFDTDHPLGDEAGTTASNLTAGANDPWYLLDTTQPLKPLIFQMRRAPELIEHDDPKQHHAAFMRNELLYGVDYRGNAGYGLWQLAHRSQAELNEDNYFAVKQNMRELTNEEGEPLEVNPNLIVVPPSLELKAKKLFLTSQYTGGGENPLYKDVEVLVVQRLAA